MTPLSEVGPQQLARGRRLSARDSHPALLESARASGVPASMLDRYRQLPAPSAAPQPMLEDDPNDNTVDSENPDSVEDGSAEHSDALAGDAENVDAAPDSDGEKPDAVDGAESESSDSMRATSRDAD